ncbi:uncharacterized protein LOC111137637 [Crassostrea virginica]|uniref:Uncharacterized protein LOC111137637 n=1 Tax=Crassostrea virginica TaxID=6565 RepID=A0A8B8EXY5_CRAVI|nr:uncharacterized protein LOC111137637 [Crassostrea virginica]
MEISNSVFVLKVYALLVAVLLAAEVHTQPQKFNTEIQQTSDDSSSELNLFKMALREAYNRELEFYETQEAQIMKQIAALENDRSHLRERKRSHIQCLVNVIACYRKK